MIGFDDLFELVISTSLTATLLWGSVAILVRLAGFAKSPRLVHMVLLVVVLRFVVLVAPQSPTSWMNWMPTIESEQQVENDMLFQTRVLSPEEAASPIPTGGALVFATPETRTVSWVSIGGLVWITGVIGLTTLLLLRIANSFQLVLRSKPLTGGRWNEIVDRLTAELGQATHVSVRQTTELPAPALAGFFRPTVLLPTWCLEELDNEELLIVLLHEIVHAKRKDLWLGVLVKSIRNIHWFNPLLWCLERQMIQLREVTCNERVIRQLSVNSSVDSVITRYGHAILKIVQKHPRAFRMDACRAGMIGFCRKDNSLKERILMLKSHKNRKPFKASFAAVAIVGILAVGFTSAQEVESQQAKGNGLAQDVYDAPQPTLRLPSAHVADAMPEEVVKADVVTRIKVYDLTPRQMDAAMDALALGKKLRERKPCITGKLDAEEIVAFEKYFEDAGIDVVHTPHMVSRNGHAARLLSGGEIPFAVQKGGVDSIEFRPFGLHIQVTTKLGKAPDAKNTVNVTLENSFLTKNETDIPGFYTRRMDTGFLCGKDQAVILGQHILNPDDQFFVDDESESIIRLCLVKSSRINPEQIEKMIRLPKAAKKNRR